MTNVEAQRISEAQIPTAGDALGRAFFDDPLQTYFLPDEEQRRTLSPPFFEMMIRYGHLFGQVYTNEQAACAAVWLPPAATEMTPERMSQAGFDDAPAIVGEDALGRFGSVMEFLEPFHKRDAPGNHWYLAVIGVDTHHQGHGLGQSLIRPILERADADGLPCYLETANGKNIPFYSKQGFDVIVDTIDPASGLRLWTFRREPRR